MDGFTKKSEVLRSLPRLSVVMPAYNAMPYLERAIESILQQSFADFEFIIGDDASTDGGWDCIMHYAQQDQRIRAFRSQVRRGPVGSSNWTASLATAPLIARMDADDIAQRDRLQLQLENIAAHPEAVLIGSLFDVIDAGQKVLLEPDFWALMSGKFPPFAHTSIMYRRATFQLVGGYSSDAEYFEDADFYERLYRHGKLLTIATPLVSYRLSGGSARLKDDPEKVERAIRRQFRSSLSRKRVPPDVFMMMGSLWLWSGHRPPLLRRMFRKMDYRPLKRSILCLGYVTLGVISPESLRMLLVVFHRYRNWRAKKSLRPGHVYQWSAGRRPIDLGPARL